MAANAGLFFRRWLANPLQMGSIVPSSSALCSRVVRNTRRLPDEAVLELGAGTGVMSRAMLASGVPAHRLIVVEIVREWRRIYGALNRSRRPAPGRGFLHYSYCATSPLPWRRHRLTARREASTPLNFPLASVWRYTPMS